MKEKEKAIKEQYRLLSNKIIKNLIHKNFDAYYCDTSEEAVQKALSFLSEQSSVSWGGSVTLEEIGLIEQIYQGNYLTIDRDKASTMEERFDLMRQALLCDTYLTSFNAISEDGILINVDNIGNRVAAIAFGPKQVIAIIGMNKVCKTVEAAIERARTYAAPINAQRCTLDPHMPSVENTPCMKVGSCGNCQVPSCICSYIVETRRCKIPKRIKVLLVGEALGF